jgi:hypothetical protein
MHRRSAVGAAAIAGPASRWMLLSKMRALGGMHFGALGDKDCALG